MSRTEMLRFEVHTWIDDVAPATHRWCAALREYDLGVHVSTGRTQREAVNELLDYYEQDNGELAPIEVAPEPQK